MKLKNDTVDLVAGKTATGRNAEEASRTFLERTKGIKPLVTREEINAWLEEKRRAWEQQNQQQ